MEINTVEDIKTKLGYEITNKDKVLYYDTILNNTYIKITLSVNIIDFSCFPTNISE